LTTARRLMNEAKNYLTIYRQLDIPGSSGDQLTFATVVH